MNGPRESVLYGYVFFLSLSLIFSPPSSNKRGNETPPAPPPKSQEKESKKEKKMMKPEVVLQCECVCVRAHPHKLTHIHRCSNVHLHISLCMHAGVNSSFDSICLRSLCVCVCCSLLLSASDCSKRGGMQTETDSCRIPILWPHYSQHHH